MGRAISFPRALQKALFPEPDTPKSKHTTRFDGFARLQGSPAEILEIREPAKGIKRLTTPMQREQVVLLQRLGLQFPDGIRPDRVVARDRKGKSTFGFISCETGCGIKHPLKVFTLRQVFWMIAGQFTGDAFELFAVRQAVFDDDEQLLQLDRVSEQPLRAPR